MVTGDWHDDSVAMMANETTTIPRRLRMMGTRRLRTATHDLRFGGFAISLIRIGGPRPSTGPRFAGTLGLADTGFRGGTGRSVAAEQNGTFRS